ncbi:MAG: Hsp70 family protein, partial [Crocinitomicaceae bacterium]|nr:Hsp70 family protein [Crocinitomicaceae bacterium]
ADIVNQADTLIFQVEKQLKEFGEKIPADKKQQIETALADLKKVHAEKDIDRIKPAMDHLNAAFQAASQEMYNNTSSTAGEATDTESKGSDAEVTDVDFEEVKDDKK